MIPVAAVAGLVGVMLGSMLGYILKRYELREAELTARVDDVVKEINSIEETASEYWSRPRKDGDSLIEGRLLGRLHRLAELLAYCKERGWMFDDDYLDDKHIAFRALVSGGAFGEDDRSADSGKVRALVGIGSDLIICIRRARRSLLSTLT